MAEKERRMLNETKRNAASRTQTQKHKKHKQQTTTTNNQQPKTEQLTTDNNNRVFICLFGIVIWNLGYDAIFIMNNA